MNSNEKRFVKHHLQQALLFPENRINYIGNSPDPKDLDELEIEKYFQELNESEFKYAVKHFQNDWYGLLGSLLKKRLLEIHLIDIMGIVK